MDKHMCICRIRSKKGPIRLRRFVPAAQHVLRELPEPGTRNFACCANYPAPGGWFNFACLRRELPAPAGTKGGGYFVFVCVDIRDLTLT